MQKRFDTREPRTRRLSALRVLVWVLALAGAAGQSVIYFGGGDQSSLNIGMPTVLAAGFLTGLAYGIAHRPFRGVGEIAPTPQPKPGLWHDNILTFTVLAVAVGELLALISLLSGSWPSGIALAAPLLYGGLFTLAAGLAGILTAEMILWPLAELLFSTEDSLRGRPVNQRVVATSLALLSLVAFAVFLSLSTHVKTTHGGTRISAIVMIARLFLDYSGGTINQIQAWIARGLAAALVVEIVWAVRAPKVASTWTRNGRS